MQNREIAKQKKGQRNEGKKICVFVGKMENGENERNGVCKCLFVFVCICIHSLWLRKRDQEKKKKRGRTAHQKMHNS